MFLLSKHDDSIYKNYTIKNNITIYNNILKEFFNIIILNCLKGETFYGK